jgi:Kef-type K+ transport system membrane component KefB
MNFFPFFIILIVGILFSTIFRRFHVPWVIGLIVAGMFVGPFGIDVFHANETMDFMGQVGLIFLMFMAGLETKLSSFKELKNRIEVLSFVNGLIPFGVGVVVGLAFGFPLQTALLLGIIFISSSVAVIIPSLEANGLSDTTFGKSIISATIIEDVASLVLLSIFLQTINPNTILPLPLFYLLLVLVLFFLRIALPKIRKFFSANSKKTADIFQQELRVIIAILIGTVISFEILGLHPIIGGFFAGLVLSDSIKSDKIIDKLHTISYGLFIPVFFVIIGTQTDISVFTNAGNLALILTIIIASIGSKFVSGYLGGRVAKFTKIESAVIGAATTAQLSTTLAVVFTGVELGIIPTDLSVAMVILSIVSIFIAPTVLRIYAESLPKTEVVYNNEKKI